jgi:hypothetical protein
MATIEQISATDIIQQLHDDIYKAKDNLLQAKIFQAHYANQH